MGGGEASIVNDPGVQWEMGGWQSDQAFCYRLLSVQSRTPKTLQRTLIEDSRSETGEIGMAPPFSYCFQSAVLFKCDKTLSALSL